MSAAEVVVLGVFVLPLVAWLVASVCILRDQAQWNREKVGKAIGEPRIEVDRLDGLDVTVTVHPAPPNGSPPPSQTGS